MIRFVALYSPAVVLLTLAMLFTIFGRTDGIVIVGSLTLAAAMTVHTYYEVHHHGDPVEDDADDSWLPERWYRDVWLFAISIVVVIAAINADNLGEQIQQSRLEVCRAQNHNHDKTGRKLDELIADLPPGPRKDTAVANKPGTLVLIDALAPKRNCKRLLSLDEVRP